MLRVHAAALLALAALTAAPAGAHPLAPALLVLSETAPGTWAVSWKTPRSRDPDARLTPVLPRDCSPTTPVTQTVPGSGVERRWTVKCASGLLGERVSVSGLDAATANALLRIERRDGGVSSHMLDAGAPGVLVEGATRPARVAQTYLALGVAHLLGGVDHVLFVAVLTLLVGWGRRLVWTITFFTAGHTATLALAALGVVRFPGAVVEPLIAFSVVLAAVELARPDPRSWLRRAPWAVAGGFGLLHGMGFAGALADVGLPPGEIPLALAAFNVGIELGQLAAIGATLALAHAAGHLSRGLALPWPAGSSRVAGYVVGTLAAVWFWQRFPFAAGIG